VGTIYKLIIEDDEGKTTVYPLSAGEISIGRKEGNTIRLMERNVSRRHARLLRNNGSVFIEDLDSYNGIRINGERINGRYEVKEGDLVEIGDYHLALQAAEIEDEARNAAEARAQKREPKEQPAEWPTAGTVPDFHLPQEVLAGVRVAAAQPRQQALEHRDTLVDTMQAPPLQPPSVVPQPSKTPPITYSGHESAQRTDEQKPPALPPFPLGGLGGPQSPGMLARQGMPTEPDRPPLLKPQQHGPRKEEPPAIPTSIGPMRTAPVPRLICVSTSYAGREFPLTRSELIIGRVEDNDIVIEHRSVSRNHAKVVFDGRAHKIIDLQSANGILVNGEEYAMTDLRKNDLIELGHVRFRFIPSGEPFSPTEEELREMHEAGVKEADETEPKLKPTDATHAMSAVQPAQAAQAKLAAPSVPRPAEPVEVPHFDPSTAATVTDTPLSALSMGSPHAPQVETPPSPPPPIRREPIIERNIRSDTAAPRGSHDSRPAETPSGRSNGASGSAHAAKNVAEPTRPRITVEPPLVQPRSSKATLVLFVIGLLGVIAVGAYYFVLKRPLEPSGESDRQLEQLLVAGDFEACVKLYDAVPLKSFKDPNRAAELRNQCQVRLQQKAVKPPTEDPGSAIDPDKHDAVAAKDEPPPADEHELEAADEHGKTHGRRGSAKTAATARPPKNVPQPAVASAAIAKTKENAAKDAAEKGRVLLLQGDLGHATDMLLKCIRLGPIPECYRNLGVIYGQLDDTQKSVEYYRKYLAAKPSAPDAQRVKEAIDHALGNKSE
jgi:pSer/pThr/pTyr-binding forkhead associated (FHA) protein